MSDEIKHLIESTAQFTNQLVNINQQLIKINENTKEINDYFMRSGFKNEYERVLDNRDQKINDLKQHITETSNKLILKMSAYVTIISAIIGVISKAF